MGRRIGMLAWLVASLIALTPRAAAACSCMFPGPACQAYWKTDAVFDATVLSISPRNPAEPLPLGQLRFADKIVKLDVRQSWKGGVETGPLEITTSGEGGSCGFPFKEGGRYLVFAFRGRTDMRLQASICSLTQEFNGSGAAADFLASLATPATGGRIFGTIRTRVRAFGADRQSTEKETETLVRLSGGGQERSALSSGGRYQFTGLSEGPYKVEAVIPEGYTTYFVTREVEIPDRRACAEENYFLSPAGRIAGHLVGPDGRGLSRVRVDVTSPDARRETAYGWLDMESASTDGDGYFEVMNLPPGRYLAGVNLQDLPSEYNPYGRTVYPGGTSDPHIVTLSLGQTVDLGTWQMPPPLATVRVAGIVTWRDGTPAAGVYVSAQDRTGNPESLARGAGGARSGADGRFVLELRQGRVYTFTAGRLNVSGPRLETGAGAPDPVRIVIQQEAPR